MTLTKNHLYILAILAIGVLSGLAAVIFKYSINFMNDIFFRGNITIADETHSYLVLGFPSLAIIIIPVIGSFIVTFLIKRFAPEAKGHGVPEVMFSIRYNKSFIRPVVAVVKSIASSISIGSGGSSGPEGPIVQIASTIGSAQFLYAKNLTELQKATLVASGAAAGLGAAFNTPISGVVFAIELLLPVISVFTLLPVMLSTAISVMIRHAVFGDDSFFYIDPSSINHSVDHSRYVLLGCLAGIASAGFIFILIKFEEFFERLKCSQYIKHSCGMLVVGIMLYFMNEYTGHYYVAGESYAATCDIFNGKIDSYSFLILLFFTKLLATCFTLGSGASGGTFSPSLFMGACLGACYYIIMQSIDPTTETHQLNFVMAGMAGMIGGTTSAILTAVVILMEATHCYYMAAPLMITVFFAYITRRMLVENSIYHSHLNKKIDTIAKNI